MTNDLFISSLAKQSNGSQERRRRCAEAEECYGGGRGDAAGGGMFPSLFKLVSGYRGGAKANVTRGYGLD